MYGITLHYSQQIKSQIIMDSDITMHSDKKTIQNYMFEVTEQFSMSKYNFDFRLPFTG